MVDEIKDAEREMDPMESAVVSKRENDKQDQGGNRSAIVLIGIGIVFLVGTPICGGLHAGSLEAYAQWIGVGGCSLAVVGSMVDLLGKSKKGEVSTIDYFSYASSWLGAIGAALAFLLLFR